MASIKKSPDGSWRVRHRDAPGREHARHLKFTDNPRDAENSAQYWRDRETSKLVTSTWVAPRTDGDHFGGVV
jgi:hypothetical protein